MTVSPSSAGGRDPVRTATRYSVVAIILHWAIALAIIGMIFLGWWMTDALHAKGAAEGVRRLGYDLTQTHKSIGITILALSVLRILWRLSHPAPPLPAEMSRLSRLIARAVHGAFYVLMIAIPMSGWALVSTSKIGVATTWFKLFTIPHLPLPRNHALHELAEDVHGKLAWVMLALLALHVAAALMHHYRLRDGVIPQMAPWTKPVARERPAVIAGWALPRWPTMIFGTVLLAGALAFWLWTQSLLAPLPRVLVAAAPAAELATGPEAGPEAGTAPPANATPPGWSATVQDPAVKPLRWIMDPARSELRFSGTHIGRPFNGRFGTFTADITFAPAALAASRASVVVDLASAKIGKAEYDSALPGSDWLDSRKIAEARFETTGFTATGPTAFVADGRLTLRGVTKDIRLPFTLVFTGDEVVMEGQTVLNRLDFAIGAKNDGGAEWVSRDIALTIRLTAKKAG